MNPPSPAARVLVPTGLAAAAIVLLLVAASAAERVAFRGQILPGIDVAAASLGGDDESRALLEMEVAAARLESRPVRAKGEGLDLSFEPADIGYDVDARATVRAARRAGRSRNPIAQVTGTVLRRFRPDEVELVATWDETRLDAALDGWGEQLAAGLENGGLRFEGAEVIVVEPKSGFGLKRAEAERRVKERLRSGSTRTMKLPLGEADPPVGRAAVERTAARARSILSAPFALTVDGFPFTITPEQVGAAMVAAPEGDELVLGVDGDLLRTALGPMLTPFDVAPVDATWTTDGAFATVVPATPGRTVDLTPVADAILAEQRAITTTTTALPAAFTTEAAQALNITEKVSEFTTNFTAGQPRVQNIHRAADIVNNTVVRPGETFSLNDTLGPRQCELGWTSAPAFSTEEGFYEECGGGVSQFSTTLFNATFFGGYKDIAHTPHSIFISRYPMGREATLGYGSIDNKFQNDSRSGVLIQTSHTETSVTVAYYGNKEGRVVTAEGPNVIEEIPPGVEYVDWPLLPAGQEAEMAGETGFTGYKVENFRVIARPGEAPQRERFYWEYDMRPRRVLRGTGT